MGIKQGEAFDNCGVGPRGECSLDVPPPPFLGFLPQDQLQGQGGISEEKPLPGPA